MTYWVLVGKCGVFALVWGIVAWVRARRPNRTPAQTKLMWRTVWCTGVMMYGAVLLTVGILVYGDPIPRQMFVPVLALFVGGAILGFIGALSHDWVARRIKRLGQDPDYGELDDLTPPPSDTDLPATGTRQP
jgi:hypothetical protein